VIWVVVDGFILNHIMQVHKGCNHDYNNKGINQIENLIKGLKTDLVSSSFNDNILSNIFQIYEFFLPCHGLIIN
jgi:flagellin-specific chaperone FliS